MVESAVFSRTLLVTCADLASTAETQSRVRWDHDRDTGNTSITIKRDGGVSRLVISPTTPFSEFFAWYFTSLGHEVATWTPEPPGSALHETP